ncbi:esterase-like activity of phytase family protein [Rhodovibrionaceae bacterium A322]
MGLASVCRSVVSCGLVAVGVLAGLSASAAKAEDFRLSVMHPLACDGPINPVGLEVETLKESGNNMSLHTNLTLGWRGGLSLKTEIKGLRGLSDLTLLPDGRIMMVSDFGYWSIIKLSFNERDELAGLTEAFSGPLKGVKGRNLCEGDKSRSDAESIAHIGGHNFLVGFERNSRFLLYTMENKNRLGAAKKRIDAPQGIERQTNQGPEAAAFLAKGQVITFSEGVKEVVDGKQAHIGWTSPPTTSNWRKLYYEKRDSLDPVAATEYGDRLLVLERAYFREENLLRHRLVEIQTKHLKKGQLAPSRVLALIESPTEVRDNLEGLAVIDLPSGGKGLLIVGDDNGGHYDQRTALLLFELKE